MIQRSGLVQHLRSRHYLGARVHTKPQTTRHSKTMKVTVKRWQAIAQWRWDTGQAHDDQDGDEDVCGICRVAFEGCCPSCKMPGDDCPLSTCVLRVFSSCLYDLAGYSVRRVYTCVPYALYYKVASNAGVEVPVSNGSSSVGYAGCCNLFFVTTSDALIQ